jgi:hypothetical protein
MSSDDCVMPVNLAEKVLYLKLDPFSMLQPLKVTWYAIK